MDATSSTSDLVVFSIPMRTRFRGITVREGVLLRGPAGWGEWSPFLEYDDVVAAPWLRCAEEAASGDWPAPVRDGVPVNVTVPAVDGARAHAIVLRGGCTTAKVKVAEPGQTLSDDVERLEAVRDALGPDGRIRVDANGYWDLDDAVTAIRALDRAAGGLEYVEQPCASVEDLARVRRRVDVPIAADESIRRAEDPYRVRDLEAADIAVLKVQPLGGVRACLRIAEDIGLPVVVSSALETSVGIAAGVALAAALPELPFACGLATVQLLTDDVAAPPLLPVDGVLPAGLPPVDPAALTRLAAAPDRVAHWQARLAAVRQDQVP
jgi:o-succinylbenzoate synthase